MARRSRPKRARRRTPPAHTKAKSGSRAATQNLFDWSMASVDVEGIKGESGWLGTDVRTLLTKIFPKIEACKGKTWGMLLSDRTERINHYPYDMLAEKNPKAVQRLEDRGLGYLRGIYSIRVTRPQRIFGYRDGDTFNVLWWDPEHNIYDPER